MQTMTDKESYQPKQPFQNLQRSHKQSSFSKTSDSGRIAIFYKQTTVLLGCKMTCPETQLRKFSQYINRDNSN